MDRKPIRFLIKLFGFCKLLNDDVHLAVLGSDPVRLPHGHVADQLAHVLNVVNVLGKQITLYL